MPLPEFKGDELSLPDAQRRYSLGKTALNARIRHCNIEPLRTGTRGFLNSDQVRILDDLHDHLESGRGMADFHTPIADVVMGEDTERTAIVRQPTPDVYLNMSAAHTPGQSYIDVLRERMEFLSLCRDEGWLLPTSDVRAILGAAPRRSGWSRYGFVFQAAGTHGQETAWAVVKDSDPV